MKSFVRCHGMRLFEPLKGSFDVKTRSRPRETGYFLGAILAILLVWVSVLFVLALTDVLDAIPSEVIGLYGVSLLSLLIPLFTLTIRRLHDQSLPWPVALIWFVPYIGWLLMLILLFRSGVTGPNRYGPDPTTADHQYLRDTFD